VNRIDGESGRRSRRSCRLVIAALALLVAAPAVQAGPDRASAPSRIDLLRPVEAPADARPRVRIDGAALAAARTARDRFVVAGVSVSDSVTVDLHLERFAVTSSETRFVRGRADGADEPLAFDAAGVTLLRGDVPGYAGSHVFIAIGETLRTGSIDLGPGAGRFGLAPVEDGAAGELTIFRSTDAGGRPPDVPLCGFESIDQPTPPPLPPGGTGGTGETEGGAGTGGPGLDVSLGLRELQLAVETDYEMYSLFNDLDAAGEYVVALFAAVSDIYARDLNTYVTLSFVRLWDDPNDLFNEPDPLVPFRNHWNAQMDSVERDAAQFLSGRRDLPYGGVAWLDALCGSSAYSVVGYVLGSFPDPAVPSVFHYDIHVTAHELGHNCGALHTHDYGIDQCQDLDSPPRRGTIMSYCSQTNSGGNANTDLFFHMTPRSIMRGVIESAACAMDDCNANGVDDATDILFQNSSDENGNGVPDECEDCNANGILDLVEIALGASDENGNGIPDECEPDCNGNGVPDDVDLLMGGETDLDGNGVPDSCEADCDGDGESDYLEILANMSLDKNRNTILDDCEDCDGDGTPDLDELANSHFAWVAGFGDTSIRQFHPLTGVLTRTSQPDKVQQGNDVVINDIGRVFVSSGGDDRVPEFNVFGTWVGDFVAAGAGGLDAPTGLTLGPDGHLYVCSSGTNSVLKYDGITGTFLGTFAAAGAGGLVAPFGLAFGLNGDLFVTSADNRILRFAGQTGTYLGEFVPAAGNGGLNGPRGLVFKADGNLLAASYNTNQILEYDGGNGAFVGQFNLGGTETALTFDGPWGLRLGRDSHVYASRHDVLDEPHDGDGPPHLHINSTRIYIFHGQTGIFLRSYVTGHDTELWQPTGFDFYPDFGTDCNANAVPDNCDIAAGTSFDDNVNGVPDECEDIDPCAADVAGNDGVIDINDLLALLGAWGTGDPVFDIAPAGAPDGVVNIQDLLTLLAAWGPCPQAQGTATPDEIIIVPSPGPRHLPDDMILPQGG
jgi:hypothetical protein